MRVLLCIAVAVTLLVSAIGAAAARTTSAGKAACKKTSGEPVLVATVSNESSPVPQPFYKPAVLAAAKAVNCDGGIQGRPLKMLTCDGNPYTDPNNGQNCAREAIEAGVVASAASASPDQAIAQAFNNAGIPMVGVALNLVGLTSPYSFNSSSGAPGIVAGPVAAMWDKGARNIRVLVFQSNLVGAINSFANSALEPRGGTMLDPVQYPPDPSADDSAVIQATVNGADGILLALNAVTNIKVIQELRAAGYKGLIATAATLAEPEVMEGIGAKEAKKLILAAGFYPATANEHAGIAEYNADMDRYAPKISRVDASISGWAAVKVIADALNKAPTIDKNALNTVLQTYKITLDVGPVIDFANGGNAYGIPRVFTPMISAQTYKNGKYYIDGDFYDPLIVPEKTTRNKK